MTVNCSKAVMALSSFLCMLDAFGGRGGGGEGVVETGANMFMWL